MKEQGFPAKRRMRSSSDFARVYRSDAFAADETLVVRVGRNDVRGCRLGLSMSRKVGNAVLRNRWKRIVREAFRRQYGRFPSGIDVVVRPRKGARPDAHAVAASLPRLIVRAARKLERSPS